MFYMFLADGFEEVEAIAALDVIRRAKIDIKTVSVSGRNAVGSHGVSVVCDLSKNDIFVSDDVEGIILPGGMPGTINLQNDETVNNFIDFCNNNNRILCAICAAPMILGEKGLLKGKEAICFPGFEDKLIGAKISDKFVCTDGNIITAKGMGSAVKFGLAVVSVVKGAKFARELEATLQCS